MATNVKYPTVTVQLTGHDGNAFVIIGRVSGALRRQVNTEAAEQFADTAMNSGSYDELLQLAMATVNVK